MIALAVGAACDGVGLDHEASTASNVADAAVRVAPTAWGVTPSRSHSFSGEASKGVHGRGRRAVGRVAVVRGERPAPHEEGRALATGHEAGERRVAACACDA